VKDPAERLGHGPRVHHLSVHDHGGCQGNVAKTEQANALLGVFDLANLDRSRANIDSDQVLSFAHGFGLASFRRGA
jgi:hypothetical protein